MRIPIIIALSVVLSAAVASGISGMATVGVYDPTGQSPREIQWPPYPAEPPPGFHWQETGSPAIKVDPTTGQPLPGQFTDRWILVRDGYRMPQMKGRRGASQP